MTEVSVQGRDITPVSKQSDEPGLLKEIMVSTARGAADGQVRFDVPDQHVIEVELANGVTLFRRLETLERGRGDRGAAPGDGITLPAVLELTDVPGARGEGASWAVRVYRFFSGEALAEAAVEIATKKVEGVLKAPGKDQLFQVGSDGCLQDLPKDFDKTLVDGPILVMIHGTASYSAGSFDPWVQADTQHASDRGTTANQQWQQLQRRYASAEPGGPAHIYAFEHRTLSESPVRNAIELLQQLPIGAELHLMSHSRGGLVGELIALGPNGLRELDKKFLPSKDYAELRKVLRARRPRVTRFVRVAAPMRGTLLASDRLDKTLSLFFNLLKLVPGAHRVMVGPFRQFVKAVVAERKDVETLPGLEAMRPESGLVAMLNQMDRGLEDRLTIVAGDIEPAGVLRGLAVMATDLFYREDHDLVVNTRAMFGGADRAQPPSEVSTAGPEVNHFSYWKNAETSHRIVEALTEPLPEQAAVDALAEDGSRGDPVPLTSSARGTSEDRPIVVLLPGIMGSHLRVKGQDTPIWLNLPRMAFGGLDKIGTSNNKLVTNVEPAGALRRFYHRLIRELRHTHDVELFDYDWRRSVVDEADNLAERIGELAAERGNAKRPIRIVAHSMGGLVVRAMIARHPDTWARIKQGEDRGTRFLMLGTPNQGSVSIAAALLARDEMMTTLARLDFTRDAKEVVSQVAPMPGVLELLPSDQGGMYLHPNTWKAFGKAKGTGWPMPTDAALKRAAKVHAVELRPSPNETEHMAYIAGTAPVTPSAIEVGDELRLLGSRNGDGRVLWRSGELPGLAMWFAPGVKHGDLCRDRSLFGPILDLLRTGQTRALSQTPPRGDASRGATALSAEEAGPIVIQPTPQLYPSAEDVEAAVLGADNTTPRDKTAAAQTPAHVDVLHGDLRLHSGTVMVGHYEDGPLLHAERALDQQLNGQLSRHRALGLYPGALRSAELFRQTEATSLYDISVAGALVVGLGPFGELSRLGLTATMTQAFLLFGLRTGPQSEDTPKAITSLLVGSNDSRVTTAQSIEAILEALHTANNMLPEDHRILKLTFLERYEDKAIDAADTLARLRERNRWGDSLSLQPVLREGVAGRKRHRFGNQLGWDQIVRISVPEGDPDSLQFEGMNQSASVSRDGVRVNRARLDRLISEATGSVQSVEDTGKLLYEWMVPPAMKSSAADGRDLTLVLDQTAAAYPWEMLQDNWGRSKDPIAVQASMTRQLINDGEASNAMVATSGRALVVGDPESYFSELPGAKVEARRVAELLKHHGWQGEIDSKVGKNVNVEYDLTLKENQILHFAGHGVFEWGADKETGLVIGKKAILEPDFVQKLRYVPQFVFLNCCYAGKVPTADDPALVAGNTPLEAVLDRPRLASNIAVEFIRAGSKAVIAAGWKVDDALAKKFAEEFYALFLDGSTFADAVQQARSAVFQQNPQINTWSAYQCYGDPQFRLRNMGLPTEPSRRDTHFVSPGQATLALRGLQLDARLAASPHDAAVINDKLHAISGVLKGHPDWSRDPELYEAMADVLAEVGDHDAAIAYYERAVRRSPPRLTVDALENLLHLRVRKCTQAREKDENKDTICAEESALNETVSFLQKHEAVSNGRGAVLRQVRLGDNFLRLAANRSSGKKADDMFWEDLKNARTAYLTAESYAAGWPEFELHHALIRRALASYMLATSDTHADDVDKSPMSPLIDRVHAELTETHIVMPSFERRRLLAETRLFGMLNDPAAGAVVREDLIETYSQLFRDGGSVGRRLEVVSDLCTVARLLGRLENPNRLFGTCIQEIADAIALQIPEIPNFLAHEKD